jgi:class 3 adenylate cyclase
MDENRTWEYHKHAHFIHFPRKILVYVFITTLVILYFHWLSFYFKSQFWISVTARMFYIPVLYGAIQGGLISGILSGFMVGIFHAGLMFYLAHHDNISHEIVLGHLLETCFLILIGFFAGGLRDHEKHEKHLKEQAREFLGRYVSPTVAKEILNQNISLEGEEKNATVLFCDLADFTSLSEKLSPKELLHLLNSFFPEIVEILLSRNAFLDKFIGDAAMAVFGVPFSQNDDADKSVEAAIAIQKRIRELNEASRFGDNTLNVTIGINTGNVVAGNVGSAIRAAYTVLGDNVNLASRIQSLNKVYKSNILISDNTFRALKNKDNLKYREIDSVLVKGKKHPCVIYDIYSGDSMYSISKKEETLSDFLSALQFYKSGDFSKSLGLFHKILNSYPEDFVSRVYISRLKVLQTRSPKDWNGIFEFTEK